MAVVAFIVVAVSSSLAGASPTSVVTRGVAAFVVFGAFGLVALRGVVYGVIRELARQAEEKRRKGHEERQAQQQHEEELPFP
jgi:flagellar biosynthesis/type III secretory pathway M-ring protein FliF/YscJ